MRIDTAGKFLLRGRCGRIDVRMPALKTAGLARERVLAAYIAMDAITNM
jgi:hypothetical protein